MVNKIVKNFIIKESIVANYFNLKKFASQLWSDYAGEPSWSYDEDRMGNVTITAPDGRTCFLQGDDAASLVSELDNCHKFLDDPQHYSWSIDHILSAYDHVCE